MDKLTMFSYEECLETSIKYYNGNELAAKVFLDKYALKNEDKIYEKTPDDMHRRIAKELARIESGKFKKPMTEDEIYEYLKGFKKIIPQGSPMYGIGNYFQIVSLSNCYVVENPKDSYGGILHTDHQLVQISKRRGGVGLDISHLRPENHPTSNAARVSTGIVPFMERFSNSIREVGQNGRRGALMITISIHHPQILDFIRVKKNLTKVTGANISIRLSNEFLNAVENDEEYEQRWPVDSKTPSISKKVKASLIWDEIIESAWSMAEPGLLFWDNIIDESPADCYSDYGFNTTSCNPCFPKWERVLGENGLISIENLNVGDKIWSSEGWTKVTRKFMTGVKDVYKYFTTSGAIHLTENHEVVTPDGKVQIKDSDTIRVMRGPTPKDSAVISPECVMDGLIIGDGTVHKASNNLILLIIGENDKDYFNSEISSLILKNRDALSPNHYEIKTSILYSELDKTYDRKIPERYISGTFCEKISFLRGLYSANGSVVGHRVTLKASSFKVIEQVQLILSSIGIVSYYTKAKGKVIKFKNGSYLCKDSYDLNISVDRLKFKNLIGFIQEYKNEKLDISIKTVKPCYRKENLDKDIVKTQYISTEDVYDISVDNQSKTFWMSGFDISNCSELTLCELDSCRLLLLNLFGYVDNPFTKDATFNFKEFYKDSQVAQRFMDDIIDLEIECIDKIIKKVNEDPEEKEIKAKELDMWKKIKGKAQQGRRTGTGITALGDTVAALGLTYGSDESIEEMGKIYNCLKLGCYRSSVDIAKELGPFPIWNYELEKDNPFLNRIKQEKYDWCDGEELYNDMKKYGRANIALLTTPPAGSTSINAAIGPYFGTSSGIEPVFKPSYIRRKKGNPGDVNFKSDFIDQNGDNWQEFKVYHQGVRLWMDITGETDIEKSPYHNSSAEEIDWKQRVKLQGVCQKHVDHAISSTVNLPEDVKKEEVAEIYQTAWKRGCKGITVYRNNCRTGVLIDSSSGKKESFNKSDAPKRPKELPCDVHHISVKGKKYFVLVGLLDGQPYEVFAGKNNEVFDKLETGKIIKIKKGFYKADFGNGEEISPITMACDEYEEALSRLTSMSLRHGADIRFVVEQLIKVNGEMNSFAKSVARALKKYIKDGIKCKQKCLKCGSENIAYQEGCPKCMDCNDSKCS